MYSKKVKGSVFQQGSQTFARTIIGDEDVTLTSRGDRYYNKNDFPVLYFLLAFCEWHELGNSLDETSIEHIARQALDDLDGHNEIVIASTPEELDSEDMRRLDGGIIHEALHSIYTVTGEELDVERMKDIMLDEYVSDLPYGKKASLLKNLFNIYEDAFIERKGVQRYKGAQNKLQALQDEVWEMEKEAREQRSFTPPIGDFMGYLRDRVQDHYLNGAPVDRYDEDVKQVVDEDFGDLIEESRKAQSSYDTFELAFRTLNRLVEQSDPSSLSSKQGDNHDHGEQQQASNQSEETESGEGHDEEESQEECNNEGSSQKEDQKGENGDQSGEERQQGAGQEKEEEGSQKGSSSSSEEADEETSESGSGDHEDVDQSQGGERQEKRSEQGQEEQGQEEQGQDGQSGKNQRGQGQSNQGEGQGGGGQGGDRDKAGQAGPSESGQNNDQGGEETSEGQHSDQGQQTSENGDEGGQNSSERSSSDAKSKQGPSSPYSKSPQQDIREKLSESDGEEIQDMQERQHEALQRTFDRATEEIEHTFPHPYSTEYDKAYDIEAEPVDAFRSYRNEIADQIQFIRPRMLKILRGKRRSKIRHRRASGDHLSSQSVSEVVYKDDPKPFCRKERAERKDSCVQFILDESNSMNRRGRLTVARDMLATLALTVGDLQIPNEIFGFTSGEEDALVQGYFGKENRRDLTAEEEDEYWQERARLKENGTYTRLLNCEYRFFRHFDDPHTPRSYSSIMKARGNGVTPLPDAMMFGAPRLLQRSEDQKIMIIVTDGDPFYDDGSGYHTEAYLDIIKNIEEALKQEGVHVMWIGIGKDYVKQFDHHLVLENGDDDTSSKVAEFLQNQLRVVQRM
jgi:hypothetical protein